MAHTPGVCHPSRLASPKSTHGAWTYHVKHTSEPPPSFRPSFLFPSLPPPFPSSLSLLLPPPPPPLLSLSHLLLPPPSPTHHHHHLRSGVEGGRWESSFSLCVITSIGECLLRCTRQCQLVSTHDSNGSSRKREVALPDCDEVSCAAR